MIGTSDIDGLTFDERAVAGKMTVSMTKTGTSTALFQNVPLELREMIYHYVVPLPSSDIFFTPRLCISAADVISASDPSCPNWLPPIARVSTGTRTDVALYILRHVELYVPYHQTMRNLHQFLDTLPEKRGQEAIRRLNFPSFGAARFAQGWETAYIDFSKGCTNLAMLTIGVNALDMRKRYEPADGVQKDNCIGDVMMDAQSMMEAYRLEELLCLTRLVRISFELCPLSNGKPVSGVVTEARRLAVLLVKMFAARDRRVDVQVIDFRGRRWQEDY